VIVRKHIHRGFQHLGFIPTRLKPWFRWLLLWRRLSPPALFMASFVVLIALGTAGLLWIPGLERGAPLGFLDALFTVTSAVCVTGLTVVDTATHFTFWGQLWILVFIELGGLGLISLTTLIIGAMGARLSLRSEMLTVAPQRHGDRPEVWQIALAVTKFSMVVQGAGALLLFGLWAFEHPLDEALWHGVFHAVSAYCNAGFSTFSDNLIGERALVLTIISLLIIVGGLGYLTFEELLRWRKHVHARRTGLRVRLRGGHRLSSHTWAVVVTTLSLLFGGWLLMAVFEWNGALAEMGVADKLANSWFLSVTPRTAGFNSVDYGVVGNDTAAFTIMLMFIGGSPGSTAGGIKTTTLAVLIALGLSRIRGLRFVGLKQRAIPEGTVERTVGMILLALLVLVVSFFLLSSVQAFGLTAVESREQFLPVAFETFSAFGTVGLSMNYTTKLQPAAEVVVIWLMFVGRVGLLSFFSAMVLKRGHIGNVRPAQEDVIVG
jgi:trk system potassium uptake protein TrkH